MHDVLTQAWKVAAVALALIPGVFGVVHYMVGAKVEALENRIIHNEKELAKGERFTAHDGKLLERGLTLHIETHAKEVHQLRETIGEIRFDDATCKANVTSLSTRFSRLEDRVYTMDLKPKTGKYRNAPYMMPIQPYDDIWPAAIHRSFD